MAERFFAFLLKPNSIKNLLVDGAKALTLCKLFMPFGLICLLLLSTVSCGYRMGRGEIAQLYSSVSVPYVEGDDQGLMTNALIYTISTRGALHYASWGADLILKVCLLPPIDENIGFAYAPEENEKKIVVSNEARLTLIAKVTLIDRCTGACVRGPVNITSFIEYDFEPDLTNIGRHAFSLGQLEMHNMAQDAAFPPLYKLLAEKIVDYVNHSW